VTNNDVLRRIRYTFDFKDAKMVDIFALAGQKVTRDQISGWLKRDDDPDFDKCSDIQLATFLNGLITERRGKKEGPYPKPEKELTNNIILRKLKIAFDLKSEDMLDVMALADMHISAHELSAFFRKIDHKHHKKCKDQVLRNVLKGLQIKYRDDAESLPEVKPEIAMAVAEKPITEKPEPVKTTKKVIHVKNLKNKSKATLSIKKKSKWDGLTKK